MAWPSNIESLNTAHQPGETILRTTDNDQARILNALMATLGVNPQGGYATVAAKIAGPTLDITDYGSPSNGSAALQAAHDALPATGGTIRADGDYTLSSTVAISKKTRLQLGPGSLTCSASVGFDATDNLLVDGVPGGDGSGATVLNYTHATGTLFRLGQTGAGAARKTFGLRNLKMVGSGSSSSVAMLLRTIEDSCFENLEIEEFFGAIRLTGNGVDTRGGVNHFDKIRVITSALDVAGMYGFWVDHAFDTFLDEVEVWHKSGGLNAAGFIFDRGTDYVVAKACQGTGGKNGVVLQKTAASYSSIYDASPINIFAHTLLADSNTDHGYLFDASLGTDIVRFCGLGCWAAAAGTPAGGSSTACGVKINGGSDIQYYGGFFRSNNYHGIHVNTAGSQVTIHGVNANDNNAANNADGDGIRVETTANVRCVLNICNGSLQKYGIRWGNAPGIVVALNSLAGNVTGPFSDGCLSLHVRTNNYTASYSDGDLNATVVPTASLPAAGTAQDGRVVIEDAGAGDRNLVIYGGGQRFRIDGGAAF